MSDATASSTTYWMVGLSTSGSISFGWALVAGRNRVPSPAAGKTPLRTFIEARLARRGPQPRSALRLGYQIARLARRGPQPRSALRLALQSCPWLLEVVHSPDGRRR